MSSNKFHSLIALLRSLKKTLFLVAIVAIASITITSLIAILLSKTTDLYIPSIGTVKTIGVEVYWDQNGENKTETIDWDIVWAGSSENMTLYVQSISNYEVTLTLNATDWIPVNISNYIILSWDYNRTSLKPGEIIPVTLTLSASSSESLIRYLITNNVQDFHFEIAITASESGTA